MFWVWTGSWRCDCNWWSYGMPVLLVAAHHAIPQIPNEFLKIIKMCLYLPLRAEFIHDFYSIFSWIKLTEKCKLTSIYSKIKILIIWLMTLFLKKSKDFLMNIEWNSISEFVNSLFQCQPQSERDIWLIYSPNDHNHWNWAGQKPGACSEMLTWVAGSIFCYEWDLCHLVLLS